MAYDKQTWADGDLITKEKLNHIEEGIASIPKGDKGDAGAKGDKGDAGATGSKGTSMRLKGAWDSATAYVNDGTYIDIVTSNGSSYACKVSNTNVAVSDTTKWTVIASKGATGAVGATGATGAKGDKGDKGADATIPKLDKIDGLAEGSDVATVVAKFNALIGDLRAKGYMTTA